MAVAWANGCWANNSWLGINAGPPNAWRGETTPVPSTSSGGGYLHDDGRFYWPKAPSRKDIAESVARERERLGITPKAARIVERTARKHVETLETDAEQVAEDLVSAIEAANLEYDTAQLQLHNFIREQLMRREIAQRVLRQINEEEAAITLLLLAM